MRLQRAKNRPPTHPGAVLREDIFPSLALSQQMIADRLGVSRRTISQILHEKRAITPDMAIRLARFLGNSPKFWLNMQSTHDLWQLENQKANQYDEIKGVA